jgi:alkylhydroperoxidase family enzyme
MIHRLIEWRLRALEREVGGSADYLRHILRVSFGAFRAFMKFGALARYRRALPPEPCYVAQLVATRDEDCGACVQIVVNLARKHGVAPEILRAALADRPDDLPPDLADVYRFAAAVVAASWDEGPLRERLRARYGEAGLVELALAIASCRVFPVTKRALGYATSCSRVEVSV